MVDESFFREIVLLKEIDEVRNQFEKTFSQEIDDFVKAVFSTYQAYELLEKEGGEDKRKAYVSAFLFNALKDLVESFSLLLLGYAVPAGNLMRHFLESIAMAILLSEKNLDVFERFLNSRYSVNKAIGEVSTQMRKGSISDIDQSGWL